MEYIDPAKLLSIDRLDVFLKKLYFDVIGGGRKESSALIINLYRKHILIRTGGNEPPDLNCENHHIKKFTIKDYELQAYELYKSIESEGFRVDRAVPVTENLLLVNGSHRLAAAISLGLESIPIARKSTGGVWGLDWFKKYFTRNELLFLIGEYIKFNKISSTAILWGMSEKYWPNILAALNDCGLKAKVINTLDLDGNFDGLYLFIHEVYGIPFWKNNNIRRKSIIHGCYSTRIAVVHIEPNPILGSNLDVGEFFKYLGEGKSHVRKIIDNKIPQNLFLTLHVPDGLKERDLLASILLSPSNLRLYKYYTFPGVSFYEEMTKFLRLFSQKLQGIKMPLEKICIVGSGSLGAFGIRIPADIDFVVHSNFYPPILHEGDISLEKIDLLANYDLSIKNIKVGTDELIANPRFHFIFFGIKFADLFYVQLKKMLGNKDKDVVDIVAIRAHIKKIKNGKTEDFKRNELLWLESGIRNGFDDCH
jgi:hypothetical protein